LVEGKRKLNFKRWRLKRLGAKEGQKKETHFRKYYRKGSKNSDENQLLDWRNIKVKIPPLKQRNMTADFKTVSSHQNKYFGIDVTFTHHCGKKFTEAIYCFCWIRLLYTCAPKFSNLLCVTRLPVDTVDFLKPIEVGRWLP